MAETNVWSVLSELLKPWSSARWKSRMFLAPHSWEYIGASHQHSATIVESSASQSSFFQKLLLSHKSWGIEHSRSNRGLYSSDLQQRPLISGTLLPRSHSTFKVEQRNKQIVFETKMSHVGCSICTIMSEVFAVWALAPQKLKQEFDCSASLSVNLDKYILHLGKIHCAT